MKLSVIVPVFNEAGNIGPLTRALRQVIGPQNELIVVDDGSTDATLADLDGTICTVLRHPVNKGKGAAMTTGLHVASGDLVVFIGGDGQDDPHELPKLTDAIERGADFVIGSRFINHTSADTGSSGLTPKRYTPEAVTPTNEIGNKVLTALLNALFGVRVTDSQAEFKCLRAHTLRTLTLRSNGYEIETEMLIRAARAGLKIVEVPVHRHRRIHGTSKLHQVPLGRLTFALRALRTIIKGYFFWR